MESAREQDYSSRLDKMSRVSLNTPEVGNVEIPRRGDSTMAPKIVGILNSTTPEVAYRSFLTLESFPKFNGKSVTKFFDELQEVFFHHGVAEELRYRLLTVLLQGDASLWFQTIGKKYVPATYPDLKEALIQAFPDYVHEKFRKSRNCAGIRGKGKQSGKTSDKRARPNETLGGISRVKLVGGFGVREQQPQLQNISSKKKTD